MYLSSVMVAVCPMWGVQRSLSSNLTSKYLALVSHGRKNFRFLSFCVIFSETVPYWLDIWWVLQLIFLGDWVFGSGVHISYFVGFWEIWGIFRSWRNYRLNIYITCHILQLVLCNLGGDVSSTMVPSLTLQTKFWQLLHYKTWLWFRLGSIWIAKLAIYLMVYISVDFMECVSWMRTSNKEFWNHFGFDFWNGEGNFFDFDENRNVANYNFEGFPSI